MTYVDWSIKGPELSTCNCAYGCPCQFNALPTYGDCQAAIATRIDEGHFGEVRLDGIHWVSLAMWPGAIHEGHGQVLTVVDERADEAQRNALLTILAGKETEPGATIFNVFVATFDKVHPPRFLPIEFEVDVEARTGRFAVPDLVRGTGEPIRNPVTGAAHRARINLPEGFEYDVAEFASSTVEATGPMAMAWERRHSLFAMIHLTPHGPVRSS